MSFVKHESNQCAIHDAAFRESLCLRGGGRSVRTIVPSVMLCGVLQSQLKHTTYVVLGLTSVFISGQRNCAVCRVGWWKTAPQMIFASAKLSIVTPPNKTRFEDGNSNRP